MPKDNDSHLAVDRFKVDNPKSIDADIIDTSQPTAPSTKGKVNANAIDVTLKNTGSTSALVSRADFTVLYAHQMKDCRQGGGEMRANADYPVKIPENVSIPTIITRDMSFQVNAGTFDRFTFSVGPEHESISSAVPWLYVVKVAVKYDAEVDPLTLGTAAVVARPGDGQPQLEAGISGGDYKCVEENSKMLDELYALPAERSADLEDLHAKFKKALEVDSQTASEVCSSADDASAPLQQGCFKFTKRDLVAKFTLTKLPMSDHTQIMMKISSKDSTISKRWAVSYLSSEWRAGFIEDDDPTTIQWSGHGCGPCKIFGGPTQIEFTAPPDMLSSLSELSITAELQDISDRQNPVKVSSLQMGTPIEVRRGQ